MTPSSQHTTATAHTIRTESETPEQSKNRARSRAAHRGITIRGGGPASGRPRRTALAAGAENARRAARGGWSTC